MFVFCWTFGRVTPEFSGTLYRGPQPSRATVIAFDSCTKLLRNTAYSRRRLCTIMCITYESNKMTFFNPFILIFKPNCHDFSSTRNKRIKTASLESAEKYQF